MFKYKIVSKKSGEEREPYINYYRNLVHKILSHIRNEKDYTIVISDVAANEQYGMDCGVHVVLNFYYFIT